MLGADAVEDREDLLVLDELPRLQNRLGRVVGVVEVEVADLPLPDPSVVVHVLEVRICPAGDCGVRDLVAAQRHSRAEQDRVVRDAGVAVGSGVGPREADDQQTSRDNREEPHPRKPTIERMRWSSFAAALAGTRIGTTFNQYACSPELRGRLAGYLESRCGAELLLVGEAAGYRGARISGIPFTSERQLTGRGPAEASATIVHRVLDELGLEEHVLLWNVVPTHPGTSTSNRRPSRAEV